MTEQRFTFDDVAEQYARTRPGYPPELFEDLYVGTHLASGARVLEIGAGPGIATAPFVERGCRLVCLEPGERLAELARARFAGRAVEVVTSTFEAYEVEPESFDLVFAAQSFHWVDPAVRCVKAHRALRRGGALAIIANRPHHADTPLDEAIEAGYARQAPHLLRRGTVPPTVDALRGVLEDSGCFGAVTYRAYRWSRVYTTAEYLDLLGTHSNHLLLPTDVRARLYDAIGEAIDAAGGRYRVPHVTLLAHAAKR